MPDDNALPPLTIEFVELPEPSKRVEIAEMIQVRNSFVDITLPEMLPSLLIKAERVSCYATIAALQVLFKHLQNINSVGFGPGHVNTHNMDAETREKFETASFPIDYQLTTDNLERLYLSTYAHYEALMLLEASPAELAMLDGRFSSLFANNIYEGMAYLTNFITNNGFCSPQVLICLDVMVPLFDILKEVEDEKNKPIA